MKKLIVRGLAAVGAVLATGAANAAAVDTTAVVAAVTDAGTALAVVGAAYVAMRYGAAVWKWLTKFSG